MNRALRLKSPLAILLAVVLLIMSALPATAADTAKQVEVRVKVGSKQISVNGEKSTIQPPFNSGKTVMVPLSAFTNAKGFGVALKPVSKSIQLTYLKHVVTIMKNSKSATIDGKKSTLPAAPVDKSGVTMVPAEAIAKAFGIKLTTDTKTKELVLKGASATPASGNSIDSDAGKTKVGDSYYQWSMNMPTNLAQNRQWEKGSKITFVDVKGVFYMAVFVEKAEEPLEAGEQSEMLKEYTYGDTILDVSEVARGTDKFQRIIVKDSGGFFYEYRGIQKNGFFYTVVFGKIAKSKSELDAYQALLDSFQTSFDKSDKSLKDLSIVKDGKIAYKNANYGLELKLPVDWNEGLVYDYGNLYDFMNSSQSNPSYRGPDGESLTVQVHSIAPNDTLDAWVGREVKFFEDMTVESYRKPVETLPITWNGVPAKLTTIQSTKDGKTWTESSIIRAIKGSYKYEVVLKYPQDEKANASAVLSEALHGMKLDFAVVEKNFGQIPDKDDSRDVSQLVTKTSKKYGFSVTVPKFWVSGPLELEEGYLTLSQSGVHFLVIAEKSGGISLSEYETKMKDQLTRTIGVKVDSSERTTYAGVDALKMQISSSGNSEEQEKAVIYLFMKNDNFFIVQGGIEAASATPLNKKQLEDALNSFTFN